MTSRPRSRRTALATAPLLTRLAGCLLAGCLLAGCTYDPPMQGDRTSERYKTDLETCRKSSMEAVRLKNADTLGTWIISPITGPPAVRAAIRTCMEGKGYALQTSGG